VSITFDVPAIEAVAVSLAMIVAVPTVLRVAEKVAVPPDRVEFAGRIAWLSLLLKCTIPV
jgi:hypothetical protein